MLVTMKSKQPVAPTKKSAKSVPDPSKNGRVKPPTAKNSTAQISLFNSGRTQQGRFAPGNPYAFPPGTSGNPGGRPKGKRISETIRAYLLRPHPDDPDGHSIGDVIGWRLAARAAGISTGPLGNARMLELLLDRVDGKARQTIENVGQAAEALRELGGDL